uniref:Conserved oligomeric Golgi complex subunit 7 n=1 Tax=Panagrellus redivivus TaxID=6233 RepID=A0A7E5A0I5_PANRE
MESFKVANEQAKCKCKCTREKCPQKQVPLRKERDLAVSQMCAGAVESRWKFFGFTYSTMEAVDAEIDRVIHTPQFDAANVLDKSDPIRDNPKESLQIIQRKITEVKTELLNYSSAISSNAVLESVNELGRVSEKLEGKLQSNLRMLKLNEGLMSCTNSILEFDTAKSRTDLLVQVLKAKILWTNSFKEIQMIEKSDRTEMYQKLVSMQQCYDVLSKYGVDEDSSMLFEKYKDEFLSWDSSATLFAIKDKDVAKLVELENRYKSLNRIKDYRQVFGFFIKNELKAYFEKRAQEESPSVYGTFKHMFDAWRHVAEMEQVLSFDEENPFKIISDSVFEIALQFWDDIMATGFNYLDNADDPLKAARDAAWERQRVADEIENWNDEVFKGHMLKLTTKLTTVFAEAYSRIVKTTLLKVLNTIEMPIKNSRRKCLWLAPQLEPLQTAMLEILHTANETFGPHDFYYWIVPPFELIFRELAAKINNNDFFRLKKIEGEQKVVTKNAPEETENQLSFIVAMGSVLQFYDNINAVIVNLATSQRAPKKEDKILLMNNRNLLDKINKKVVQNYARNLASSIIDQMAIGMNEMKNLQNPVHASAANLPSFSRAPHNYILGVGHELLSQMNVISAYSNNSAFTSAIITAAGGRLGEDETDVWLLNIIADIVMRAICESVGDLSKLPAHVVKQLQADISYFIDAANDLHLNPSKELLELSKRLTA